MIARDRSAQGITIDALPKRTHVRFEIAWSFAGEALSQAPAPIRRVIFGDRPPYGSVRLVAVVSVHEKESVPAEALLRLERGEGVEAAAVQLARIDRIVSARDEATRTIGIDGFGTDATIGVTIRECADGVALLYARTSVFDLLGVPGGRVEPPTLLSAE